MKLNVLKAVVAGLAGTAVMTMFMLLAPAMGMPPMNIGAMLGSVMGGSVALGWAAHFMIGTILAWPTRCSSRRGSPARPPSSGASTAYCPG